MSVRKMSRAKREHLLAVIAGTTCTCGTAIPFGARQCLGCYRREHKSPWGRGVWKDHTRRALRELWR